MSHFGFVVLGMVLGVTVTLVIEYFWYKNSNKGE